MRTHKAFLLIAAGLLLSACTPQPDQTAPTLTLNATPDTITGAGTVTLSAAATDNVGVTKVSFYHGTTLLGEDTTAPYEAKDAVAEQNAAGQRPYRAVAVDAAGNSTEKTVTVAVQPLPPVPDTVAPTLTLTASPTTLAGAGTVTLTADAMDDRGVAKVSFYQGMTLLGEDTTAPYEVSETVAAQNTQSQRDYRAVAVDAAGNSTEKTVEVTIQPASPVALPALKVQMATGTKVMFYSRKVENDTYVHLQLSEGTVATGGQLSLNEIPAELLAQSFTAFPPLTDMPSNCQSTMTDSNPGLNYVETYFRAATNANLSGSVGLALLNPDGSLPASHTAYLGGFPNHFWYADRTTMIAGTVTCTYPNETQITTLDLRMKKGWNFVQQQFSYDTATKTTTISMKTYDLNTATLVAP